MLLDLFTTVPNITYGIFSDAKHFRGEFLIHYYIYLVTEQPITQGNVLWIIALPLYIYDLLSGKMMMLIGNHWIVVWFYKHLWWMMLFLHDYHSKWWSGDQGYCFISYHTSNIYIYTYCIIWTIKSVNSFPNNQTIYFHFVTVVEHICLSFALIHNE